MAGDEKFSPNEPYQTSHTVLSIGATPPPGWTGLWQRHSCVLGHPVSLRVSADLLLLPVELVIAAQLQSTQVTEHHTEKGMAPGLCESHVRVAGSCSIRLPHFEIR